MATIYPVTIVRADGSAITTYDDPSGSTMEMLTPPPGFDPLAADEKALALYGFPSAPTDAEDYDAWYAAMKAYRWSAPSTEPFAVAVGRARSGEGFGSVGPWAGYAAGTPGTQSHTYVAVKGNFKVPTNSGTTCSSSNKVGFWIGLGGTGGTYPYDNLVQQGIACGDPDLGGGAAYRPFYEFANTELAKPMCGQASWTLSAGDTIYQNMSFQTSNNRGYFYTEDQTSGKAFACNYAPPTGWHWDLNTAEWIAEAPGAYSVNFGGVTFSNDRAELYSNSTWVTLGSQPQTLYVEKDDHVPGHYYECIHPGSISGGTSFLNDWVASQCKYVSP
jgi:hypothetical protein